MIDETENKEALIERFLAGDGRQRRAVLKELRPLLLREDVERIAPALRDPSPKIAARVVSLLARHDLIDCFEAQLAGLKPGKIDILRRHYDRIAKERDNDSRVSPNA
ncbi:MAG: hypothetical protein AAF581_00445 [Planctomycetota bacterium]